MALYLGGQKKKLVLNNSANTLKIFTPNSILMSSDNYILKDKNGVRLTTERSE